MTLEKRIAKLRAQYEATEELFSHSEDYSDFRAVIKTHAQALDALEVYDETLRSNLVTLEAAHENIVSRLNAQIALTRQALAQADAKIQ